MATITIKDIPDELYEKLKETAKLHRRSINSEVIMCIESAITSRRLTPDKTIALAREIRKMTAGVPISDEDLSNAIDTGRI